MRLRKIIEDAGTHDSSASVWSRHSGEMVFHACSVVEVEAALGRMGITIVDFDRDFFLAHRCGVSSE